MTLIKGGLTLINWSALRTADAAADSFGAFSIPAGRYLTTLKAAKRFNL